MQVRTTCDHKEIGIIKKRARAYHTYQFAIQITDMHYTYGYGYSPIFVTIFINAERSALSQ